jgi:hypothetical protein
MIVEKYLDFDDLYHNLNKNILFNPTKYVNYIKGKGAYLYTSFIETINYDCNIDLGELIYSKNKFYKLIKSYLDLKEWDLFKEKLKTTKGNSLTFYFKKDKKQQGTTSDNGPCILSMVFTRKKDVFDKVFIYYRTTELNRRFGADLVFFHHLLKDLKNITNLNSINFVFPLSYIQLLNIPLTLKLENINIQDIKDSYFHNMIEKDINNILKGEKLSSYKTKRRMQLLTLNKLKIENIDINQLNLRKENKKL